MRIYIDESGTFVPTAFLRRPVSAVGALIVSETAHESLLHEYRLLRLPWLKTVGEVKGRALGEREIDSVVRLLIRHDAIFQVVGVDMQVATAANVTAMRHLQAETLLGNIPAGHNPDVAAQISRVADRIRIEPNQLFVQGQALVELVMQVIDTATPYYAIRAPAELGQWHWVLDAKDIGAHPTPSEDLWRSLVAPFIASRYIMGKLPGADYSAMNRFRRPIVRRIGETEDPAARGLDRTGVDTEKLLGENFRRANSESELGLQLIDIILSCFARAANGSLGERGWKHLGRLLIRRSPSTIAILVPGCIKDQLGSFHTPHGEVIEAITRTARPMFTDAYNRWLRLKLDAEERTEE